MPIERTENGPCTAAGCTRASYAHGGGMSDIVHYAPAPVVSDRELAYLKGEAVQLARQNLIPSALKNKPDDVLALVTWGAVIGMRPAVAVQAIHLIDGRPYPSGRALVAAAKARGHRVDCTKSTAESCTVVGLRRGDPIEFLCEVTYTLAEAQAAGLTGKDVWKRYKSDMLYWRAARRVVDRVCPEVVLGLADAGWGFLDDDEPPATHTVTATVDQPAALEPPPAAPAPRWCDEWRQRCVAAGVDRATSAALIAFATEGRAGTSVDVTVDDRPACDLMLDRYAEDRPEDLAAWLAEPGDAA